MEGAYVGDVGEFDDGHRKVVEVDGRRVVVLRHEGAYHALEATCLHAGGPLAEGMITPRVETVVDDEGRAVCDRLSEDTFHLVCPWHGWEYDLGTGEFAGDRRRRVASYQVRVEGTAVHVAGRPQGVRR